MSHERPTPPPSEVEPKPVDISDRVRALFEMPRPRGMDFMKAKFALQKELQDNPPTALTLTLDYTTLDDAKTLKWLLQSEQGNKWKFAIRANESQEKEAANVFASGVECIRIDE